MISFFKKKDKNCFYMQRRKFLLSGSLGLGALFLGGCAQNKEKDTMLLPMNIEVLSSIRRFFNENKIDYDQYLGKGEFSTSIWFESESPPLPNSAGETFPMEYNVSFLSGTCVKFPIMRQVIVDVNAGHITGFWGWLPAGDMVELDEALSLATQITSALKTAGYSGVGEGKHISPEQIAANNGQYNHSLWERPIKGKSATGQLELQLTILSSASFGGSTLPPFSAFFTSGDRKNVRYGVRMKTVVSSVIRSEIIKLGQARNMLVNKVAGDTVSNRLWYDDPNWRPEGWNGNFL